MDIASIAGQYGLGGFALFIIWQLHRKELRTLIREHQKTNHFLRVMVMALGRHDLLEQERD